MGGTVPKRLRALVVLTALLAAVVVAFIAILYAASNSLRRSPEQIRASLLRDCPPGTDMEAVRSFLDQRGWRDQHYDEGRGFSNPDAPAVAIGAQSLHADLGRYYELIPPLPTWVEAFYGFDANGRLIDIRVRKTMDGP
jgi:hypothetical protein